MIEEILRGIGQFLTTFTRIIGDAVNPQALEGIIVLGAIAIIIRILDGGVSLPKIPKLKRKDEEEDDAYEIVMRRKKK